jgi:hypothetical protein
MIKIKLLNILIIFLLFCIFTDTSFSLEALSKEKMKTTTGQRALTDISTSGDTTRLFLNTHIETFTEIESLKLAYFERNGTMGWDQNWNNLSFGNQDTNLTIDGLVIKADFVNLESSEPVLKRFIIGSNMLNGSISGNFDSFTGTYNPKLLDPNSSDTAQVHIRQQLNSGNTTTFNFDSSTENQGFFLILSPEAANQGIHAVFGFNEGNISGNFVADHWWNAP